MFFFDYLRLKARDAVLAGVQDALDQIDPALAGQAAQAVAGGTVPQLGAAETAPAETGAVPPATTPSPPAPPPGPGGSLQERLAQATTALGPTTTALTPPKPSSPRRGRGRPGQGGEA